MEAVSEDFDWSSHDNSSNPIARGKYGVLVNPKKAVEWGMTNGGSVDPLIPAWATTIFIA